MANNVSKPVMITVRNFHKKFKKFEIKNINFTVFKGTIHALVGRSGSGKSVLLKSIIGAIPASNYKGKIMINGHIAGSALSKNSLGYSLNLENFPPGISGYNFLKFLGQSTTISENDLIINLEVMLKSFGLWEHRHKSLNAYSSGMKNRMMLITALVHDPDLIILDEPGANLDSESRKYFSLVLKDLKAQGKTIFLTTHMLNEAKDIVDNCTIIDFGDLIYSGPISKFEVGKIFVLNTSNNLALLPLLKNANFKFNYAKETDTILVQLLNKNKISELNSILQKHHLAIYNLEEKELDLTFLKSFL